MIDNNIIEKIKLSEKIYIMPHISVDGDGICSSIALCIALKKLKKDVKVVIEEAIPKFLEFVSGIDNVTLYKENQEKADLLIVLDTGDLERLGKRKVHFLSCAETINIDHHKTNTRFAKYNWVDSKASATGEMIFNLIKQLNIELDTSIASLLYIAISMDTGGFRFSNTTSSTHNTIGELMNFDVDIMDISKRVFDNTSINRLKLYSKAIDKIELHENGKICMIVISENDIKDVGATDEDSFGLVSIGRNIEGVEVSVVIKRLIDGTVKLNFRSNYYFDVAKVALKYGGGGHARAAGATTEGNLDEIKTNLLNEILLDI